MKFSRFTAIMAALLAVIALVMAPALATPASAGSPNPNETCTTGYWDDGTPYTSCYYQYEKGNRIIYGGSYEDPWYWDIWKAVYNTVTGIWRYNSRSGSNS